MNYQSKTKWISAREFGEIYSISKSQVYNLIHSKGFPVQKLGEKTYRINLNEVEEYLKQKF